ncbi:hypothetical protein ACHAXN_011217 [Cyclotella atomus]
MSAAAPNKCIYLDYNGTTPIHPSVINAMMPYLTHHFGNPSSSHFYGYEPKRAVHQARLSLLKLIQPRDYTDADADSSCIVFTGCGTESNNLAIRLALLSSMHKANAQTGLLHVVTTNIEHPAISQCLASYSLENNNNGGMTPKITVTHVPVNKEGIVSTQDVLDAIQPNTALVTVMAANNEVGSIQPVFEIAAACRERNVLFHTDAAQAVGKIDLRGLAHEDVGADMITMVGHKFGAPKGIAALYIRKQCVREDDSVLLMGGGQEGGRRGGTENVPYIVGIGRASELLLEQQALEDGSKLEVWQCNARRMEQMRDRLLKNLTCGLENHTVVRANGPSCATNRLPNTLSVGLRGIQSGMLLSRIGNVVACSAGSACHSSSSSSGCSYSSILKTMEVPPEYAVGTLRLSVGPDTTSEDIDRAASIIVEEVRRHKRFKDSY